MNNLNKRLFKTEGDSNEPKRNLKDISAKAWSQKLLVALLCAASFYGGWKSHESNMVKECYANGGQVIEGEKTLLCELS